MERIYQFGRFQVRDMGWRGRIMLALYVALGLAVAVALVVLSIGLAIVLLPIVAVALIYARWKLRKLQDEAEKAARSGERGSRVIEIDYRVVGDPDDRHRR
jgi:membrane protein implicated in regulation of membrane protease activity